METITLTIETTPEAVEIANFLLGQAIDSALESESFREHFSVTKEEIQKADPFRKALLKAYLDK